MASFGQLAPMQVDVAADAQSMAAALTAVRVAGDARERLARLDALLAALKALTVRDVEPDQPLFDALFALLVAGWRGALDSEAARSVDMLATGLLALPEFAVGGIGVSDALLDACFDQMLLPEPAEPVQRGGGPRGSASVQLPGGVSMVAGSAPPPAMAVSGGAAPPAPSGYATACADAATRAPTSGASLAARLSCARAVLDWGYRHQLSLRPALRARIGRTLLALAATAGPPPPGMRALLQSLTLITAGFGAPTSAHRGLLLSVLVPLHRPAGRLDETTPHLSLYHEALVHNMTLLLKRQPALLLPTLSGVLQMWPAPQEGNSGKEVLLLHEVEQLIELALPEDARKLSLAMAPMLARAVGSENSRLAERALALFASEPVRASSPCGETGEEGGALERNLCRDLPCQECDRSLFAPSTLYTVHYTLTPPLCTTAAYTHPCALIWISASNLPSWAILISLIPRFLSLLTPPLAPAQGPHCPYPLFPLPNDTPPRPSPRRSAPSCYPTLAVPSPSSSPPSPAPSHPTGTAL
jgi:hypothetical protein